MYLNVVIARHLLLSASVSAWPSAKPEQPTPTLSRLRWRWRWRCRWRTAATQADCKNKTILFYHINIPICQPIRDEQKFSSIMYFLTMKYNLFGKKKRLISSCSHPVTASVVVSVWAQSGHSGSSWQGVVLVLASRSLSSHSVSVSWPGDRWPSHTTGIL